MKQRKAKAMKVTLALASVLMAAMPISASAAEDAQTQQVRQLLGNLHVSGVTVDALKDKDIPQMIESLQDPYTVYFSKDEYSQFSSSLENNYVGIGVRIGMDDKGVYIVEVFPGSSAEKAGIQRDDYIIGVDGTTFDSNVTPDTVKNKIVGEPGSETKVTVQRGDQQLTLPVVRQAINIPEVYSKMFGNGVGYIQVTDFSSDADEDFAAKLKELQAQGLQSLIIDLRNNGGGLVQSALNIAKNFIKDGTLIHTKDRNGIDEPVQITGGSTLNVPVYILANEYSASASEVLSGAMQDYSVAKVIGMQTFGKGSVQQVIPLKDGGALKVTIEEYLTPNMHKVNKTGITPDIKADGSAAQMITALHEAGVTDVDVEVTKHTVTMNGVEVSDAFPLFRENGQLYAPTRALAALIDAGITWNEDTRTVSVTTEAGSQSFPVEADKLMIINGTSFVNVSLFDQLFPQLHVSEQGEQVTLSAAKES